LDGVVGEISFGELIQGDANDLAAEESDEESEDDSSSVFDSDEDESDESTESIVEPKPITRPQTIALNNLRPRSGSHSEKPAMHAPRARTLSLKSVTSSRHGRSAPPVPPVPKNISHLALSKPLPPRPTPSSCDERMPPKLQVIQKRKKKGAATLGYPELVHLQKLLPVFTEMMRPHLRPRAI